MVGGSGRGD